MNEEKLPPKAFMPSKIAPVKGGRPKERKSEAMQMENVLEEPGIAFFEHNSNVMTNSSRLNCITNIQKGSSISRKVSKTIYSSRTTYI